MTVDPFFTVFTKQGKGYVLVDMFTAKGTLEAMGGEVQGPGKLSAVLSTVRGRSSEARVLRGAPRCVGYESTKGSQFSGNVIGAADHGRSGWLYQLVLL
jgi:hypothetical protein